MTVIATAQRSADRSSAVVSHPGPGSPGLKSLPSMIDPPSACVVRDGSGGGAFHAWVDRTFSVSTSRGMGAANCRGHAMGSGSTRASNMAVSSPGRREGGCDGRRIRLGRVRSPEAVPRKLWPDYVKAMFYFEAFRLRGSIGVVCRTPSRGMPLGASWPASGRTRQARSAPRPSGRSPPRRLGVADRGCGT